jgi:phosphatidylserine/phosphatidylglycerophosphate/cardiolipin synthase-like enzyme
MRLRWGRGLALTAGLACLATAVWQTHKPLPPGMHVASPVCTVNGSQVAFIPDITAADAYGHPAVSQGIQDALLRVIGGAQRFVVLDYALIGAAASADAPQRRIATELTDALVKLRRERPGVRVLFLTDPANERFGTARVPELTLLRAAGVEVVPVQLDALRDPNFLYSSLWRLTLNWWGGPPGEAGALARALNFKADHRKVVIADDVRGGLIALVSSANPLERESAWSNAAVRFSGAAAAVLLKSELAVARFSGWHGEAGGPEPAAGADPACDAATPATLGAAQVRVQVLTEGAIRQQLLEQLAAAVRGDSIDIAAFKLADRGVLYALLEAARRGVRVRLILDPSEDGTTLTPSGLPNQPLASELVSRSAGAVHVRWYRTHGERFHTSLAVISGAGRVWLLAGSANFTRRGLEDYNLDADVALEMTRDAPLADEALGYFETLWSNRAALGIEYTADFAAFADPSQADYWLCRLLEGAGVVAF